MQSKNRKLPYTSGWENFPPPTFFWFYFGRKYFECITYDVRSKIPKKKKINKPPPKKVNVVNCYGNEIKIEM